MSIGTRPPRGDFNIGELARRSGVAVPNIRYYEEVGVLPRARRSVSGQRYYETADLERLKFVRNCRELGFPLDEVRALLHLSKAENRTCDEARDLAAKQLEAVRARMRELRSLEMELSAQVSACEASCLGGPASDCSIFAEAGAKPAKCGPPPLVFPDPDATKS